MRARWRPLTSAARPRRSAMVRATTSADCGSSSAITARAITRTPACSRRKCFATCSRRHAPFSATDRRDPAPHRRTHRRHPRLRPVDETWKLHAALKSQIESRGGKTSTVLLVAHPGDPLFGVLVRREYRIEHLADDALVDD